MSWTSSGGILLTVKAITTNENGVYNDEGYPVMPHHGETDNATDIWQQVKEQVEDAALLNNDGYCHRELRWQNATVRGPCGGGAVFVASVQRWASLLHMPCAVRPRAGVPPTVDHARAHACSAGAARGCAAGGPGIVHDSHCPGPLYGASARSKLLAGATGASVRGHSRQQERRQQLPVRSLCAVAQQMQADAVPGALQAVHSGAGHRCLEPHPAAAPAPDHVQAAVSARRHPAHPALHAPAQQHALRPCCVCAAPAHHPGKRLGRFVGAGASVQQALCFLKGCRCPVMQQPSGSAICEGGGAALTDAISALHAWEAQQLGSWLADEQRRRLDTNGTDAFDGYDSLQGSSTSEHTAMAAAAAAAATGVAPEQLAGAVAEQLQGEPEPDLVTLRWPLSRANDSGAADMLFIP